MKRFLLGAAAALSLALPATAMAAPPDRTLATPNTACRALVEWEAGGYTGFADCMRKLMHDVRSYQFPANPEDPNSPLIGLAENCAALEAGFTDPETGELFQVTYPFTFAEGPDWPFPVLTAAKQQAVRNRALYLPHPGKRLRRIAVALTNTTKPGRMGRASSCVLRSKALYPDVAGTFAQRKNEARSWGLSVPRKREVVAARCKTRRRCDALRS